MPCILLLMNKLSAAKRTKILSLLLEGMSMRAVSRIEDVSINTVTKLLVDAGHACAKYHDETVRDVPAARVQCDEIWSFCYAKAKNVSQRMPLLALVTFGPGRLSTAIAS